MSYSWEVGREGDGANASNGMGPRKIRSGTVVLNPNARCNCDFARCNGLSPKTAERLQAHPSLGFSALLPSQAQVFKGVFNRRDAVVHSRTGSGKTIAYLLPIVERYFADLGAAIAAPDRSQVGYPAAIKAGAQANKDGSDDEDASAVPTHPVDPAVPLNPTGPFLIIFVTTNELAIQTRDVARAVYGGGKIPKKTIKADTADAAQEEEGATADGKKKPASLANPTYNWHHRPLRIAVAGFDNLNDQDGEGTPDILIGTVASLDHLIRGPSSSAAGKQQKSAGDNGDDESSEDDESDDDEEESAANNKKRGRDEGGNSDNKKKKFNNSRRNKRFFDAKAVAKKCPVDLSGIRAVVVDEVDATLGPSFAATGRRFKKLLKVIRVSNGAISAGLAPGADFRAAHYILLGATIPNWVLAAGFLGQKKFYYRLVGAGEEKLPGQLKCFSAPTTSLSTSASSPAAATTKKVSLKQRHAQCFATVESVLRTTGCGRTVIFAPFSGIVDDITKALSSAFSSSSPKAVVDSKKKKGIKSNNSSSDSENSYSFRALSGTSSETERIRAITEFNNGDVNALICTDAQARGLDFVAVDTVIVAGLHSTSGGAAAMGGGNNNSVNYAVDTFIHRAGRTARNNGSGRVVVVYDPATDNAALRQIELVTHASFARWFPGCSFLDLEGGDENGNDEGEEEIEEQTDSSSSKTTKKNSSSKGAAAKTKASAKFCLRVKKAFVGKKNTAAVSPAEAALRKALTAKSIKKGYQILSSSKAQEEEEEEDSGGDTTTTSKVSEVEFSCDLSLVPAVKKALWQYDVKELC